MSTPTWHHDFLEARRSIQGNMFIVNPTVIQVFQIFYQYRQTIKLVDLETILTKETSYDVKFFKSVMVQRMEKAYEKLMIGYVCYWFWPISQLTRIFIGGIQPFSTYFTKAMSRNTGLD